MISAFYAALSGLLIVKLAIDVIKIRRAKKISIGDGEDKQLQLATRTHANAIEYIPITLLLLFALEFNGASKLLIHALGIAFVTGRVLHALGLPNDDMPKRVLGMQITLYLIIGLAALNLVYLVIN